MPKRQLKTRIAVNQDNLCAITGTELPTDLALIDTDRLIPKMEGGTYLDGNTQIVDPVAHMQRHGILRTREQALDQLKSLYDDRVQMLKLKLKENNQLLAYDRRVDSKNQATMDFLTEHLKPIEARLGVIDRTITKAIQAYPDRLAQIALKVDGIGPITVAALTVYIDFAKQVCGRCHKMRVPIKKEERHPKCSYCRCDDDTIPLTDAVSTISSLWKYVGLHTPSGDRYTKGEAGGGNQTLRTVLWNTANSLWKLNGTEENERIHSPYRDLMDRVKLRLSMSDRIVKSRNTEGKLIECAWKNTKPGHRHGAALRVGMKQILADYFVVGRTLLGKPVRPIYSVEYLGHTHETNPRERGWEF